MNVHPEPSKHSSRSTVDDLEVKDAQLIFSPVWKQLEADHGRANLTFPKELILLGGAPGAGKGTNTNFIREVRDISAHPIVVSELLSSPEAQSIKARGGMVGDREVVNLVFRELLLPEYFNGAILDGFPRTKVQVECLKLLYDEMVALRREFANTPDIIHFKQPQFHIMVLFVEEAESIRRQLRRGQEVLEHNQEVERSGIGIKWEERATDFDDKLARDRYRVFKEQTYDALVSLKQIFHFHFINAQAPLDVVQQSIQRELDYQSSLELDPDTFHAVNRIPVASNIVKHARRDLVSRLDQYEVEQSELFHAVIDLIDEKLIPIVIRHAISGRATINSEAPVLNDPAALTMLIDVFSERGYHASIDVHRDQVPVKFDTTTGEIECRQKGVQNHHSFQGLEDPSRIMAGRHRDVTCQRIASDK